MKPLKHIILSLICLFTLLHVKAQNVRICGEVHRGYMFQHLVFNYGPPIEYDSYGKEIKTDTIPFCKTTAELVFFEGMLITTSQLQQLKLESKNAVNGYCTYNKKGDSPCAATV